MTTPPNIEREELRTHIVKELSYIQVNMLRQLGGTTLTSDEEALIERSADEAMRWVDKYIGQAVKKAECRLLINLMDTRNIHASVTNGHIHVKNVDYEYWRRTGVSLLNSSNPTTPHQKEEGGE